MPKATLSKKQCEETIKTLKARFEKNMQRMSAKRPYCDHGVANFVCGGTCDLPFEI